MNRKGLTDRIKEKVNILKKDTIIIYHAIQYKRTPFVAKLFGVLAIAYLLSPIDLIPDFIPVIGLLDDLIIVPALIHISIKLIPLQILAEIKERVDLKIHLKKKWYYAIPIIMVYLMIAIWLLQKYILSSKS